MSRVENAVLAAVKFLGGEVGELALRVELEDICGWEWPPVDKAIDDLLDAGLLDASFGYDAIGRVEPVVKLPAA